MFSTADIEDISQVTSLNRNSSTPRDVQHSTKNTQVAKQNNNEEFTLNMLIKEMVFCIAIAITAYGALHNTPSKISKHPQAVRFFSSHSVVTDWYRGQLGRALTSVNNADISFVMYYAPWDAESQYVRQEYEKAAKILNDRVHFSAINCWNPGSECRLQHNKIPSWPILIVYTVNSRGVLYKGPRDAHSMVKFLELIMKPLERVSSTEDLVNLLSYCDAVAIGFTPMDQTSKHYNVWYHVALRAKEFDVMGEICFAAVTSQELAIELGVDIVPSARLMLWNETKEFKLEDYNIQSWNESRLVSWVLESFTQPVARIIPMWKKAFSFERFVDGNPILMLFTPLNPLYPQIPLFDLLREVTMEYYNCQNNKTSQWITELIKLQQIQRLLYQQNDDIKFCQEYKFKKVIKPKRYYKKGVVSQNNKYPWSNTTQKTKKTGFYNFIAKRGLAISKTFDDESKLLSLDLLQECNMKMLPAEKSFYDNLKQCQSKHEKFEFETETSHEKYQETSMLPFEDDHLSPENLIQENIKHFCRFLRFAAEWGPVVLPKNVSDDITHITGLGCKKNYTLNMIAIDSIRNHHFAEALGIDIVNRKDRTAVVILDSKHESQYLLSEEFSDKSIREFIYNFTQKQNKRSLRTHVHDAEHTHYFGSDGVNEMEHNKTVQLIDLTTKTFRKTVRTAKTVTIVAVCGGTCGSHVARSVTEAARLLSTCGVTTRAARIDALRHDLPWHFTTTTYPALLVFDATRGGEPDSRSFPIQVRISTSGVVALALRSLTTPHHLRVRLALCAKTKEKTGKKTCLNDIKEHVTTLVDRNLKYWRRTEDEQLKYALLKRLQFLHPLYLQLNLFHIKDLTENSKLQNTVLNSLSILSANWNIDISLLGKKVKMSSSIS